MNGISIPDETGSAAPLCRRGFVVAAAVLVPLLGASPAAAQPPRGARRIGYLAAGSPTDNARRLPWGRPPRDMLSSSAGWLASRLSIVET